MAWQILKALLILVAVFVPVIGARLLFSSYFDRWFSKSENSYFSIGLPVTKEGFMLSGALIIIVIGLLLLINLYM